jgi:hypothetical protein
MGRNGGGGWPSTTGNPSGGGRDNNTPDDDDDEGTGYISSDYNFFSWRSPYAYPKPIPKPTKIEGTIIIDAPGVMVIRKAPRKEAEAEPTPTSTTKNPPALVRRSTRVSDASGQAASDGEGKGNGQDPQ